MKNTQYFEKFGYTNEYLDKILPISRSKKSGNREPCMCSECGKFFSGIAAFDKHRSGDDRHCLTEKEMLVKGMVQLNNRRWVTARMPTRTYVMAKLDEINQNPLG